MKRFLNSVVFSLVAMNVAIMADETRPKLVVNIIVDQLRTDYLEYLKGYFGKDGFRALMDKGVYIKNVDFNVPEMDAVSSTAMIMTGNYPNQNGVAAERRFDAASRRSVPTLLKGVSGTDYSPESLRLSTISDEISIDGIGLSSIYSISADPQVAAILSGHAGSYATWFNPATGQWSGLSYYNSKNQPFGMKKSLASRIDTMQWKPMMPLERYPGVPAQKRYYPFSYTFPSRSKDSYERFFQSGLASREITDVAIDYLTTLKLGNRGDVIDVLNLEYSAAPFKYVKDGDYRLELTDTYLRLDKDLERLFNAINKNVGLNNTLIFLSSTGYYNDAVIDDEKYKIPGGEISYKKAVSLLNSYLTAMHGNAEYVSGFVGNMIYLNHSAIEAKRLSVSEISKEAAAFIEKMSGIATATVMNDIASENTRDRMAMKLMIDPANGGDIYVKFSPGWTVVNDYDFPVVKKPVRSMMALSPAFFYGKNISPKTIDAEVEVVDLAPTVTRMLHIRSPNGSVSKGLVF